MRLSELRPCDNCGGKLVPHFYILKYSLVLINQREANVTLAMAENFGSLEIAEVMTPGREIKIAGEENAELWSKLFICQNCFMRPLNLAEVAERKHDKELQTVEED